jgi:steroid 5-alpha reductase family enzyme
MEKISEKKSFSRGKSFLICLLVYIVAFQFAFGTSIFVKSLHPIFVMAIADIIATISVFIFSVMFKNSSLYDPYWSVAPIPIAIYWIFTPAVSGVNLIRLIIVMVLVGFWAIRLTVNWAIGWEGLQYEDWRYVNLRNQTGKGYWFVSFLGIHFFPTVLVFTGCLPLYVVLSAGSNPFGIIDVIAIIVTLSAIIIETIADSQMKKFRDNKDRKPEDIITSGLWKYSRHPNYFGEVSFWVGIYIFSLSANPSYWWTLAGPVVMILLFSFISIPMMEKHILKSRPNYVDYQKRTSPLIIWFSKN